MYTFNLDLSGNCAGLSSLSLQKINVEYIIERRRKRCKKLIITKFGRIMLLKGMGRCQGSRDTMTVTEDHEDGPSKAQVLWRYSRAARVAVGGREVTGTQPTPTITDATLPSAWCETASYFTLHRLAIRNRCICSVQADGKAPLHVKCLGRLFLVTRCGNFLILLLWYTVFPYRY